MCGLLLGRPQAIIVPAWNKMLDVQERPWAVSGVARAVGTFQLNIWIRTIRKCVGDELGLTLMRRLPLSLLSAPSIVKHLILRQPPRGTPLWLSSCVHERNAMLKILLSKAWLLLRTGSGRCVQV